MSLSKLQKRIQSILKSMLEFMIREMPKAKALSIH